MALLLLNRDQRTATAGVALTAIGIVPLLIYLFVDVRNPDRTINDVSSFTSTTTLILLIAASLWLVAYFAGPGRRYGFYLGAALLALWLVAVVQIVDSPLNQVFDGFSTSSPFTPVDPSFDGTTTDEFGTGDEFNQFDEQFLPEPENPSTQLGWASLVFGGAYLAGAAWRDRRRDHRQATVLFAVAVPILTLGVVFLSEPFDTSGAAVLGIGLGAVAVWVGTRTGRRFTSWYGTLAVVIGSLVLVAEALGESPRASGLALLVVGLVVALVASRLDRTGRMGSVSSGPAPAGQLYPGGPPGGPGWQTGPPAQGPPGAPPWGQGAPPTSPPDPAWGGPPLTPAPPTPPGPPPGAAPWPSGPPETSQGPVPWSPAPGSPPADRPPDGDR